jgi:hypothetical protein
MMEEELEPVQEQEVKEEVDMYPNAGGYVSDETDHEHEDDSDDEMEPMATEEETERALQAAQQVSDSFAVGTQHDAERFQPGINDHYTADGTRQHDLVSLFPRHDDGTSDEHEWDE